MTRLTRWILGWSMAQIRLGIVNFICENWLPIVGAFLLATALAVGIVSPQGRHSNESQTEASSNP